MRIEVLYFEGCPNHASAVARLRTILREEGLPADVAEILVKNKSAARALNFIGSPSIRVDGLDIEIEARNVEEVGFACRRYPGGLPSEEMIRLALKEARERTNHG